MNGTSAAALLTDGVPGRTRKADQYSSAEFLIEGLCVLYQFKIWEEASSFLSVLVNEKSEILPRLKVGDTLRVKYYAHDGLYPSEYKKTAIRHITRNEEGRLKGHILVGLEILKG